jgi:ankyrin repeat protein
MVVHRAIQTLAALVLLATLGCSSSSRDEQFLDAVMRGRPGMVKLFIALGADVDLVFPDDHTQKTPLLWACAMGGAYPNGDHRSVVETLLQSGADITAEDAFGNRAVGIAAASGATDVLGVLLDHGADINHRGSGGNTPLISASRAGQLETVKFLLKRDADPSTRNSKGETAEDVATERDEIVRVLREAGRAG